MQICVTVPCFFTVRGNLLHFRFSENVFRKGLIVEGNVDGYGLWQGSMKLVFKYPKHYVCEDC